MKEVIALNALLQAGGDVSIAKAAVTIRISPRTWYKAIAKFWELRDGTTRNG